MQIRHPVSPKEGKKMDTSQMREAFLIEDLFKKDEITMVYSHIDRIITCGALPVDKELVIEAGEALAAEYFLERREMGLLNIGGKGTVKIDGKEYNLGSRDGMYVGMGAKDISLSSADKSEPARFYFLSAPAHRTYPTKLVTINDAGQVHLGSKAESNLRTIYQYIHPAVLESCQLVMGITLLEPENVWNTMPTHTHDRRMEVYMYCDLAGDNVVFHYMGEPDETRHIVMRNEQAVINPSWSIHSGCGTTNYSFIWGMVGENQSFTDMDHIAMTDLK